MNKGLKKKVSALDPKFKKKINELMESMHESISLLYEAATHDEKTGLYNNKFFDSILNLEIEKVKRGHENLSLVIIDIDYFKKINDFYGHIKADEILERLAKVLQNHIRKTDIVARFGGEEFIILLPETNLKKAEKFSKRLKAAIHSDNFLRRYKLSVSGGITQFKKLDTKKTFKERADKALYHAKKSGRDRFVAVK